MLRSFSSESVTFSGKSRPEGMHSRYRIVLQLWSPVKPQMPPISFSRHLQKAVFPDYWNTKGKATLLLQHYSFTGQLQQVNTQMTIKDVTFELLCALFKDPKGYLFIQFQGWDFQWVGGLCSFRFLTQQHLSQTSCFQAYLIVSLCISSYCHFCI